jgi:uncharacterized protein YqeY
MSLKIRLRDDMQTAQRSKDKPRLGVIRLIMAAIKQREVDERTELDDEQVLVILDKMAKQRRESIEQFRQANRTDLADQETFELELIRTYLPAALSAEELTYLIDQALSDSGAESVRDMGQVMGLLKPQVQGRADMSAVSAQVKQRLSH